MSTRPILGGNPSDTQQKQESGPDAPRPEHQKGVDLPLAVELPNWDLVPPDTLLVRRRPVKK